MEEESAIIGVVFLFLLVLFFLPLLFMLGGAFSGWMLGWWFPKTAHALLEWLHLAVQPWQLGLMLGFIGSFLRISEAPNFKDR